MEAQTQREPRDTNSGWQAPAEQGRGRLAEVSEDADSESDHERCPGTYAERPTDQRDGLRDRNTERCCDFKVRGFRTDRDGERHWQWRRIQ